MSEKIKKKTQSEDPRKPRFNRGRQPGNTKITWHTKLKEILEQSLKKKPRYIDEEFIKSYCGKFPSDLPTKKNRDPRDSKKIQLEY